MSGSLPRPTGIYQKWLPKTSSVRICFTASASIPLELPALRHRRDDIPILADHFLARLNASMGKKIDRISDEALKKLESHEWPGNVRELEERAGTRFHFGKRPANCLLSIFPKACRRIPACVWSRTFLMKDSILKCMSRAFRRGFSKRRCAGPMESRSSGGTAAHVLPFFSPLHAEVQHSVLTATACRARYEPRIERI